MPEEKVYFKTSEGTVGILPSQVEEFKKDVPDAVQVSLFTVKNEQGKTDTLGIQQDQVEEFLKDIPDAKPLNLGKPLAEPSKSSGGKSQSNVGEFGFNQTISAEKPKQPIVPKEERVPKPSEFAPKPQVIAPFAGLKESAESLPKKEKVGEERYPEMIASLRNDQSQVLPQYNELEKLVTQQAAELEQNKAEIEAQLNDPNVPDELKLQLQNDFNANVENYKQAIGQLESLGKQVTQNQKAINVLDAGYKRQGGQYQKEMEVIFDKQPFIDKATGAFNEFSSATYNTVVPSIVSTVGALLKSPMLNPLAGSGVNFINEKAGDALLKLSNQLEVDAKTLNTKSGVMSTESQSSKRLADDINPYNFAQGMGNLAGSLGMTMLGGGVAGVAGGQAAAFSQIYGNSYKDGIEAGLDNNQATMYASAIAVPSAILEQFGVSKLFDLAVTKGGKKILQEAVLSELKKNAGKMTAKEIFDFTTKKVGQIVASGAVEGGVEVSQGAAEFLTKLGTEAITNADFEGNLDEDEFKKQAYENFAFGMIGGSGASLAIQNSPQAINQVAAEVLTSPQKMQDFKDNLESLRISGDITTEGYNAANAALDNAINVSKTVPPTITDVQKRATAIDLIQKRDELTKQLETTDPDLAAPITEQLDAIKGQLQDLAKGIKPQISEQQSAELDKQEEITPNTQTDAVQEQTASEVPLQSETTVSEEVVKGESQAEPQIATQESKTEEVKPKGELVTVYHGGEYGDKSGNLYVTEDKSQANEYAKGNEGDVIKYTLDKSKIATEEDFVKAFEEEGIELDDELKLYELIDERFETALNEEEKEKVFENLRKKGFEAAAFTDEDLSLNNKIGVENIVVFDSENLEDNSVEVKERRAYELLDEGYKPLINGKLKDNFTEDDIADYFSNNKSIEMVSPKQQQNLTPNTTKNESKLQDGQENVSETKNAEGSESNQKDGNKKENVLTETDPLTDLANQLGEAAKEVVNNEQTNETKTETNIPSTAQADKGGQQSVVQEVNKKPENESKLSKGKIDTSALKTRLVEGKLPKRLRTAIEKNGITYEVENQDLAKQYADAIISEVGLKDAVALAQSGNITGATKTFILGANVDDAAKTNDISTLNNAINVFDEALKAAGREISAANAVYMNSAEGIYAYKKSKLITYAKDKTTKGKTGEAVTNVKNEVSAARKETAKTVAEKVANKATTTTNGQRKERRESALKRKAKALEKIKLSRGNLTSGGLSKEAIEGYVELGAANIELGYYRFEDWVRRMNRDLKAIGEKLDRKTLTDIWNSKNDNDVSLKEQALEAEKKAVVEGNFDISKTVKARLISEDGSLRDKIVDIMANETERSRTIQELTDNIINELTLQTELSEQEIEKLSKEFSAAFSKEMTEKAKKILDNQFKSRPLENLKKRKSQNDKIVETIILGAMDDAQFREQFYDKLGLNFVNNPDFNEGLKEMAKYVHNSPEGMLKEQAEREMDTYIKIAKNEQYNWSQLALSQIMNNFLLGSDTIFKAFEYNTTKVLIDTINNAVSNPKNAKFLLQKAFGNKGAGVLDLKFSKNGFFMGMYGMQKSNGSKSETQAEILAKNAKTKAGRLLGKYQQLSGKALSSLDLMVSGRSAYTKFSELLLNELNAQNKKLPKDKQYSTKQIQGLVNEAIGNTQEHVAEAQKQAEAEIKATYGIAEIPKKGKERVALNARIIEILNSGRFDRVENLEADAKWFSLIENDNLKKYIEYSDEYGKKNSLVGTPEGSAQLASFFFNWVGTKAPITKILQISPLFINAPINFANFVVNSNLLLGALRLASFSYKGRRGLLLGNDAAEELKLYGKDSENFNQRLFEDERNRLIKKYVTSQVATVAMLALCGFFNEEDDEEKTKDWEKRPYFLTGSISGDRKKVDAYKAIGLEPYTLYHYGTKVLNYKTSPSAIYFAQAAYIMDKVNFGDGKFDKNDLDTYTLGSIASLEFTTEASSLTAVRDMIDAVIGRGAFENVSDSQKLAYLLEKNLTSTARGLVIPAVIPAITKDVQGMLEMDKKKAVKTGEQFFNDIPLLEGMIENKMLDPFGRTVKERPASPSPILGIPLVGWNNGTFESPLADSKITDKYYDLVVKNGYYPSMYKQNTYSIMVTNEEYTGLTKKGFDVAVQDNPDLAETDYKFIDVNLTKQQIYDINKIRGEYVRDFIDENYDMLNSLEPSTFKKMISSAYEQGTAIGKTEILK